MWFRNFTFPIDGKYKSSAIQPFGKSGFLLLDAKSRTLVALDSNLSNGYEFAKISTKWDTVLNETNVAYPFHFLINGTMPIVIDPVFNNYEFCKANSLVANEFSKFNYKFKRKYFSIHRLKDNISYSPENECFISSFYRDNFFYPGRYKKNKKNWQKFVRTEGNIAIINNKGKVESLIGGYSDIYKGEKILSYIDDVFLYLSPKTNHILLSQAATPEIRIYKTTGELLTSFGEKGRFIPDSIIYPSISSYADFKSHHYFYRCLVPIYSEVFSDSSETFCFRIIQLPVPQEQLSYDSSYYNAVLADEKAGKRSCFRPNPLTDEYLKSRNNYPFVLQVYHLGSFKLENEYLIEAPFAQFLKFENDTLIFQCYERYLPGIRLYYLKLNKRT